MNSDEKTPLSAAQLEARRQNAQKSTGPRTLAGKARVAENPIQHGGYAVKKPSLTRSLYISMQELGEDPEEFSRLQRALIKSFHAATAVEIMLVEDIAMLRWRRWRLERAQAALVARRVQDLYAQRERKSLEVSREMDAEITASQLQTGLFWDQDSPAKFNKILEWLEGLRQRLEARQISDAETLIGWIYGPNPTTRGAQIKNLFRALAEPNANLARDSPQVMHLRSQLLLEIASMTQLFDLYLRDYVEFSPTMRDECLVPEKNQRLMLRELNSIDRAIEHKTSLLLKMQGARRGGREHSAYERAGDSRPAGHPKDRRHE
jgi:hypothetical protein